MELSEHLIEELSVVAREVSKRAYCPYSRFPVGAALLTAGGEIVPGCNIENVSFGLTMCAERTAVFRAVASGTQTLKAIVIFTPTRSPTPPCGACRQVLSEFALDAEVICVCNGQEEIRTTVRELLPGVFSPQNLA